MPHAEYDLLVDRSPQGTLFSSSWWLDAVAPGRWQPNAVVEDGAAVAAWPTVARRGRFGIEHGGAPLTPWLGPMFEPGLRRSLEDEMTGRLLDRIGRYAQLTARCAPAYDYWTPLYWRGFSQTTRYTWRIEDLSDLDACFARLRNKVRGAVRRAQREEMTVGNGTLDDFLALHSNSLERQQRRHERQGRDAVRRIDPAAAERGARTILIARDREGRPAAGGYFVHDSRSTYYLMGGVSADGEAPYAVPLLLWTAIEQAAGRGTAFDFEGSMLRQIELLVRGFGGDPVPYSVVRHVPSAPLRGAVALRRLAAR
jgi:Acetyltransferase (GNAT) domain